jgi:hypothetical protein
MPQRPLFSPLQPITAKIFLLACGGTAYMLYTAEDPSPKPPMKFNIASPYLVYAADGVERTHQADGCEDFLGGLRRKRLDGVRRPGRLTHPSAEV